MGHAVAKTAPAADRFHHWCLLPCFNLLFLLYAMRPSLAVALAANVALGWWAIHDSVVRRQPIPLLSRNWFIAVPILLVPLYLIYSRGWWGVALIVGQFVVWVALLMAVVIVVQVTSLTIQP